MSFSAKAKLVVQALLIDRQIPLPASLEPYRALIEQMLSDVGSGIIGAYLYRYVRRYRQDPAKIQLAVFHIIRIVETNDRFEDLISRPHDLIAEMQEEVMVMVEKHLTANEGETVMKELKRKLWKQEIEVPASKRRALAMPQNNLPATYVSSSGEQSEDDAVQVQSRSGASTDITGTAPQQQAKAVQQSPKTVPLGHTSGQVHTNTAHNPKSLMTSEVSKVSPPPTSNTIAKRLFRKIASGFGFNYNKSSASDKESSSSEKHTNANKSTNRRIPFVLRGKTPRAEPSAEGYNKVPLQNGTAHEASNDEEVPESQASAEAAPPQQATLPQKPWEWLKKPQGAINKAIANSFDPDSPVNKYSDRRAIGRARAQLLGKTYTNGQPTSSRSNTAAKPPNTLARTSPAYVSITTAWKGTSTQLSPIAEGGSVPSSVEIGTQYRVAESRKLWGSLKSSRIEANNHSPVKVPQATPPPLRKTHLVNIMDGAPTIRPTPRSPSPPSSEEAVSVEDEGADMAMVDIDDTQVLHRHEEDEDEEAAIQAALNDQLLAESYAHEVTTNAVEQQSPSGSRPRADLPTTTPTPAPQVSPRTPHLPPPTHVIELDPGETIEVTIKQTQTQAQTQGQEQEQEREHSPAGSRHSPEHSPTSSSHSRSTSTSTPGAGRPRKEAKTSKRSETVGVRKAKATTKTRGNKVVSETPGSSGRGVVGETPRRSARVNKYTGGYR